MEATCSSDITVDFQLTARHYIPQNRTLHNHRCENFKFYVLYICEDKFAYSIANTSQRPKQKYQHLWSESLAAKIDVREMVLIHKQCCVSVSPKKKTYPKK
jgi:hypothetical protein